MTRSSESDDTPRYKVGKVIERYSLDGLGDELEARWIGDRAGSASLRELAVYFNTQVLHSVLTESRLQQSSRDVETIYEVLTGNDVSRGERTRIEKTLERDGIDVDRLQQDFVSHQAIHTYLTNERGVQKPDEPTDQIESGRQTINRLRSRLVAVAETTLSSLRDTGRLSLGTFDILVEVNVHCTDCQTHKSISELLSDRGCECGETE